MNIQRCADSRRPTNASFYGQINGMRECRPPALGAISVAWVLRSNGELFYRNMATQTFVRLQHAVIRCSVIADTVTKHNLARPDKRRTCGTESTAKAPNIRPAHGNSRR